MANKEHAMWGGMEATFLYYNQFGLDSSEKWRRTFLWEEVELEVSFCVI